MARSKRHSFDLTGRQFGKLTVEGIDQKQTRNNPGRIWGCRCECGTYTTSGTYDLTAGRKASCGCVHYKHGFAFGDKSKRPPEYEVWGNIIKRCTNPNRKEYQNYGGRETKVCQRWLNSFQAFYEDVSERPSSQHQIDRIDNNGHYEPNNVRWVLPDENRRNNRHLRYCTINGVTRYLEEWAEILGISKRTVHYRLRKGYTLEQALTMPRKTRNKRSN